MNQTYQTIIGTSVMHYRMFGHGQKLLFCFHGYGKDSLSFEFLENKIGDKYTIVALDTPFHGYTQWRTSKALQCQELLEWIHQVCKQKGNSEKKYSLMGYSMGGRVALGITEAAPEQVERLLLIAPDGLNKLWWRSIFLDTKVGQKMLRYTIAHPRWIQGAISLAEKFNIIHKSKAEFARYYIDSKEKRQILYSRWMSLRKMNPDPEQIKKQVKVHSIQVKMLFGAFDKIISSRGGLHFLQGIEKFATLKIVDAGHNLLGEMQATSITDLFTT